MKPRPLGRLMLVTNRHRARGRDLVGVVADAVRGGVDVVQVREPDLEEPELGHLVRRVHEALPAGTPLLVNGSARTARAFEVGLHLPARSPALGDVERPWPYYGRSIHDEDEMRVAMADRVDYVVLGTVFETASKPGQKPAGLALVERIGRQAHPLRIYAIGGVSVSRIPPLLHAGAFGVAVSSAILEAREPGRVAQAMELALRVARRVQEGERDH